MKLQLTSTIVLATLLFSGCIGTAGDEAIYGTATGGTINAGFINQAGSSTVLPLAEVWAEDFGSKRGVDIRVAGGGSGAGATKLCAKEVDLGDMSRQMRDSERDGPCKASGVVPVQWKIAYDALSVVVSKGNTFATDLDVEQLHSIFAAGGATNWRTIDASFPNQPIRLCYPDADSGTYEYFNEAIEIDTPRTGSGVQQSADDNVLVNCISNDQYAIGYFGLAYLEENLDKVKAVKVGGVEPSAAHVNDGTYEPLSRFIYIYTNGVPSGILHDYMHYVIHPEGGQRFVSGVGYVPLDEATTTAMMAQLA